MSTKRQAGKMGLREIKSILAKLGIVGKFGRTVTGWEVEVTQADSRKLLRAVPGLSGYRTGYGSWVLSQDYADKGDFNDSSSMHHYAGAPRTAEEILQWATRSATRKVADSSGAQILYTLVDRRGLMALKATMQKAGDQQSVDLLREIQGELLNRFSLTSDTEDAVNRLANLAKSSNVHPDGLRNGIFKVANSLKLRLPSAMFASESRTAAITMREVGMINEMTDGNDHLEALQTLARLLGMRTQAMGCEGLKIIRKAEGHLPGEVVDLQNRYRKEVYAKARTVMVIDDSGNKVSLKELLT